MFRFVTLYDWKGLAPDGQRTHGQLAADSPDVVRAALKRQGIVALSLRPRWRLLPAGKPVCWRDQVTLNRQLANLLCARLPLATALDLLLEQYPEHTALQTLLASIKNEVENGLSLSRAFRQHPSVFNELACNLVRIGEQSGDLGGLLRQLAEHQEKLLAVQAKIRKALWYPATLLIIAILVFSLLLILVVPQFEQLFAGVGTPLPWATRAAFAASRGLRARGWAVLGLLVTGGVSLFLCRKPLWRWGRRLMRRALALPVLGSALRNTLLARFAHTLATTLEAGLPLTAALASTEEAIAHPLYEGALRKVRTAVQNGIPLDQALRQTGLFPREVLQRIAVGQATGTLAAMLRRLAETYAGRLDALVDALGNALEPLLLLVLGVMIGGLMIALYMPLFDLGHVV